MKYVLDFILANWKDILTVVCLILSIVFFLVRKKPVKVVDTLKEIICRLLPYCINHCENLPKGEKLSACLTLLGQLLADMGYELTNDYRDFAIEQVENILSTPQKKEARVENEK